EVGIVWAAGPLAGIFGQVIIGLISDNVWFWGGRRRPFILIGGALAALTLLALPNIHHISSFLGIENLMVVAIMVALTLDMAINISFNPTRSLIADVTPEGVQRTKGYTWMQTISGTFGVLAYAIGALLNNYVLIYFGVFLVFAFSVIPMFFIKESKELKTTADAQSEPQAKTTFGGALRVLEPLLGFIPFALYFLVIKLANIQVEQGVNDSILIAFLIVQLFFTFKVILRKEEGLSEGKAKEIGFKKVLAAHAYSWIGVQTMFVYMFAYIKDVKYTGVTELTDANNNEIGGIIAISFLILNAVGALLPATTLEPIAKKLGRVKTHYVAIGIMALGYLLIVLLKNTIADSTIILYVVMAIVGIGWGAIVSLPFAIMSEKVDKTKMGFYMGIFNLSVVLPQLIVSLGIGTIIQAADSKNIIFIISTSSLALSTFLWTFIKDKKVSKEQFE
ncbi:MAG: MFS transporter, partial [Ignavibacteriales bacterium]|nr:MFS transporter [Ignavibacteriales bacterium]